MPSTKNEIIRTVKEAEYIQASHPFLGGPDHLVAQGAPGGPGAPSDHPPQTLFKYFRRYNCTIKYVLKNTDMNKYKHISKLYR